MRSSAAERNECNYTRHQVPRKSIYMYREQNCGNGRKKYIVYFFISRISTYLDIKYPIYKQPQVEAV